MGRTRAIALGFLVAGTLGVALAYATAFAPPAVVAAGPWIMAVALPMMMLSLMILGAVRHGRGLRVLAVPMFLVVVLVPGGFLLALALPPEALGDQLWLGLPRRAAVILYGVGLLPLFILPLAYAASFDTTTLAQADVEALRAMRRARETSDAADEFDASDASKAKHGPHR